MSTVCPPPSPPSELPPTDLPEPTNQNSPNGSSPGDPDVGALFARLYTELHRGARRLMSRQRADHTLQATALVNEVYVRLSGTDSEFEDYGHFLCSAARAMRHILIDHHRSKQASHRPGQRVNVELGLIAAPFEERAIDLLALNDLLDRLAEEDPEAAQLVELRFFGGATLEEISETLDIPRRTLDRRWQAIRLLLHSRLK